MGERFKSDVRAFKRSRIWRVMKHDLTERLTVAQAELASKDVRDLFDLAFLKGEVLTTAFMLTLPDLLEEQSDQFDDTDDSDTDMSEDDVPLEP